MNLIAFFSPQEILSVGLLAGEPTKGALLKTVEMLKPERLLLIVRPHEEQAMEALKRLLPDKTHVEFITLPDGACDNMSQLMDALQRENETLLSYQEAAVMNAGSPQQRAVLWLLKHEGVLRGSMIDPPSDYTFIPFDTPPSPKVKEAAKPFGETLTEETPVLQNWEYVARQAGCLGKSPRFRQTLEEAVAMAGHPTPILLMGETGCGKEVLARFVHLLSPRAQKPLVTVNCAALPETLAESILFGHEKGAFTGAYKRQKGKFEQADGGTLFLDELGELSLANQAKLLRVLETRSVDLLGGMEPVKVDVRVIAATNRNLQQEVAAGRFREDLYYRLRTGEIEIPPLRERVSDIPIIALHLLNRLNSTLANPKQFSKAAIKFLEGQRWPGNVRDLMNTIERAVLMCPRTVIEPEDFKVMAEPIKPGNGHATTPHLYPGFEIEEYLQKVRQDIFEKALRQAGGNKSEAARLLGITPQAIHKYLRQQEILRTESKPAEATSQV